MRQALRNVSPGIRAILLIALCISTSAPALAAENVERRLYAALDGYLAVYDIDHDHALIKMLDITGKRAPAQPQGVNGAGVFRGICADPASARLYVTYNPTDELICYDLVHEKVIWKNKYGPQVDSQAITPDGKRIYLPCKGDTAWWVVDARSGEALEKIEVASQPHNTNIVGDGAHVYMETRSQPFVYIAETKSNEVVGKIRFSDTVRPFSVSPDERYVFATVDHLLGFEVADVATKTKLFRVEATTPPERVRQVETKGDGPHGCPSHGIGLRPDKPEVWVVNTVYGYLHVFDVSGLPAKGPKHVADVPLFEKPTDRPEPGWVCFSLDGKYAYSPGDAVVDTESKRVVKRIATSEKMIEIDFENGKSVRAARRMW
jgi:DNA-binding beta-propeller fold protein YncE